MTDNELLSLMAEDPQKGLSAVIGKYSAYVMKIVRIKLNGCPQEDMEEAASDVFMGFFRSAQECGCKVRSVKALLAVIAVRRCADILKEHLRHAGKVAEEDAGNELSESPDTQRIELLDALHKLGEPDCSIFLRKYFIGQKSSEIAADLSMKTNTVDKRISRGLARLKEMLKEGM